MRVFKLVSLSSFECNFNSSTLTLNFMLSSIWFSTHTLAKTYLRRCFMFSRCRPLFVESLTQARCSLPTPTTSHFQNGQVHLRPRCRWSDRRSVHQQQQPPHFLLHDWWHPCSEPGGKQFNIVFPTGCKAERESGFSELALHPFYYIC